MAQKDIEQIAEQMRLEEEAAKACEEAYEKMCERQRQIEAEEFEQLEDEIIDPAAMGFVDSEDTTCTDGSCESDAFYDVNEYEKSLEEDISDCLKNEDETVDESEGQATIEVEVVNDDGFGKYFANEVMKNVPGVSAKQLKRTTPDGDLVVKISGLVPDLQKAYAFYLGQKDFMLLPQDDREEFDSLLVFDDGDTLAEADYREAVAHCLDPVGVNASTADLIAQDTCAINLIREEKIRRKACKMAKALCEGDFSALSDEDLEKLEGIQNALTGDAGVDGMTDDERKVWDTMLGILGYTQEEWDKLTPEQKDKAFKNNADLSKQLSKTGFASYLTKVDPKTGKIVRYTDQYQVKDPSTGDSTVTAFNPNYSSDDSMYQHPKAFQRKQRKEVEKLDAERREEIAKQAMKNARGKDTWSMSDWANMLSPLTSKEREQLMNDLIDEIQSEVADKKVAANEVMAIKQMFGQDPTLRDIGASWDKAHTVVKKLADDVELALHVAMRKTTGNQSFSRSQLDNIIQNPVLREKFIKVFNNELNAKKAGKNPVDPERSMKHTEWLKMLKDLGYNPARWEKLSTDQQLELMDKYYASKDAQQG